jgi:hypothetical protein
MLLGYEQCDVWQHVLDSGFAAKAKPKAKPNSPFGSRLVKPNQVHFLPPQALVH